MAACCLGWWLAGSRCSKITYCTRGFAFGTWQPVAASDEGLCIPQARFVSLGQVWCRNYAEPLCKSLVYAHVSSSSRLSMPSVRYGDEFKIKRMCFCLRGADFHLSQSPLWLNSSEPWSTCPGLLLWVAPGEPMSHFHTPCSSPTFNDLPMVIFTKRLFLLARNKFPFSTIADILLKLDSGCRMPNRKWPSKMQINLWQNVFVYLLDVSILNLCHNVYHNCDLAASISLLLEWCLVFICSKKWIFSQFSIYFYTTSSIKACLYSHVFHYICH